MIPELRKPVIKNLENQGNPWTSQEEDYLFTRYRELRQSGQNKKDIIEIIGEELGRGRWSIEKAIKKMGIKDENRHPQ